ncbi:PIR protein [Plasmodium yoelii]|uniref:PIR protein n=1 Tax=Plasmodium yoelii TaxID=5861 RepID=A0A077W6F7_PLAYE|nr:PIR protein [Plasmodium yoelii]CDU16858.1 YIR protein [Plasmodium yoelii]VTZ74542.1 PIR protein [Plasmodium yoelii]|eukprot:XP_022810822.1 PIR protein [Plasmodium yoelii]
MNVNMYTFLNDSLFKDYCDNKKCVTDLDKIHAVCLFLFDNFFGGVDSFTVNAKSNINIVDYIIIWLSYMLSLNKNMNYKNIYDFYEKNIKNNNKYTARISGVNDYNSYNDLIDKKKDLLNINFEDMSKFYDAFNKLCTIYGGLDINYSNCDNCLKKSKEFAKKYDDLNENYNNTKDSPYVQLLSTLSNDYDNFKNIYKNAKSINFPILPTYSRRSVIKKTLMSIGFVFVAASILLGVSYKYSLFGFRKRSKKHLREKLKK